MNYQVHLHSPQPRRHHRSRAAAAAAFTLIEIMVVLIIIAILMGIVIPAVIGAIKKAKVTKTRSDMVAISQALEAYKDDHHGRYPGQAPQGVAPNTGFAMLGRELAGIYGTGYLPNSTSPVYDDPNDPPPFTSSAIVGDCVQTNPVTSFVALADTTLAPAGNPTIWAPFDPHDHQPGPGGRIAAGTKKLGPYLTGDHSHIQGCALLDNFTDPLYQHGHPILYFPVRGKADIHKQVTTQNGSASSFMDAGVAAARFDANDNVQFFVRPADGAVTTNAVKRIQTMLGDLNGNGIIDQPGESTEYPNGGNYILWSAGPDGLFGPVTVPATAPPTVTDVSKCDDIIVFSP